MILEGLLELRSLRIGPSSHPSNGMTWWPSGFDNATGVAVTEFSSLENTPVWQAVMLISGFGSATPLLTYAGAPPERTRDHRLHFLLHDEPNPESTAIVFKQAQWINRLLWGNSYAEIVRDARNAPTEIYHLPSWLVKPKRVFKRLGAGVTFDAEAATPEDRLRGGTIMYEVSDGQGGKPIWLSPLQMFHVPYMSVNGLVGLSPICTHPEAIALGLAMQHSAAHIFANAPLLSGVIQMPRDQQIQPLSPEGERALIAAFNAHHAGVTKRGRVAVLQEGAEFKEVRVPLNELQFIENMKNQVPEVARIFNLPPYFLGHDGSQNTYSNISAEMKRLYLQTLRPLMAADQQEISRKLISAKEYGRVYVEYETKSFLEADPEMQARVIDMFFKMGVISREAIARVMNFAPVPAGDGGYYKAPSPPAFGAPAEKPEDDAPEEDDEGDAEPKKLPPPGNRALEGMLRAAIQRAVNRETKEIRRQVERLAGDPAGFLTWLDGYFAREWPEFVTELLEPALGAEAGGYARALATHHRGELRAALAKQDPQAVLGLLETWTTTAPAEEAGRALERLTLSN